ncbi:MAG: alpha-galactosidase [Clostridia bacterium]|nr:alpha-galactosidase [Clostridia bacterium]
MKLRVPNNVSIYFDDTKVELDSSLRCKDGYVKLDLNENEMKVYASAYEKGISFIRIRWNEATRLDVKVLGDAWERGYGDLQWQTIRPERCMPWYIAVSNGSDTCRDFSNRLTECMGVKVQPNAFAFWQYDERGVTLWLDIRNGGKGTLLSGRELDCATVVFEEYAEMSAYSALCLFASVMSPEPYLPDHVVYGSNNWYYAYGKSSHKEIVEDTKFVKRMCQGLENIPYMVIDDGWQPNSCDAPWDRGNERFPDMALLAEEIKKQGVRPGIWVRYLINGRDDEPRKVDTFPEEWYLSRCNKVLDPSHPQVIEYVKETTKRIVDWGYTLIKHDFSTFDIFGRWGFELNDAITMGDWGFYDRTRTSCEIVKDFYKAIKDSSNGAVIIGCNCIGHLCAGIHQLNRTGDDTSGFEWSRTAKMGVNTLAFRANQNRSFFMSDADCVGITGAIDWSLNREWLLALAQSGSPLFVSCKPNVLNESEERELKEAFRIASFQKDELVPLDWMETTTPSRYLINGKETTFNWYTSEGNLIFNPRLYK